MTTDANTARICPACLGGFETAAADGTLVRHGWNAFDVRHGEHTGWHTGACAGYGAPAFETPAGLAWAKSFHPQIVAMVARLEARATELEARAAEMKAAAENADPQTRRALDVDAQRDEWLAALASDREVEKQARDAAREAASAASATRRQAVEAELGRKAHAAAIESWVEGAAPVVRTKLVHASGAGCSIARDEKKPRDTVVEEEVTCPECLARLADEAAARENLADLDDLLALVYASQDLAKLTPTKLGDKVTAMGRGKKVRLKGLTDAHRAAAEAVGRYFSGESALVFAHWSRKLTREKRDAKAAGTA
jgi:hypothetical protein